MNNQAERPIGSADSARGTGAHGRWAERLRQCGGAVMLRFTFGALLATGGVFLLAVGLLGQPVMAHAGAITVTGLVAIVAGCVMVAGWLEEVMK
jgi:hypothetical protein